MWFPVDAGEAAIVVVDDESSQMDVGDAAIVLLGGDSSQGSEGLGGHSYTPDRVRPSDEIPKDLQPDWSALQLTPPLAVKDKGRDLPVTGSHLPDWSAVESSPPWTPPTTRAAPDSSKKDVGTPPTKRAALESLRADVGSQPAIRDGSDSLQKHVGFQVPVLPVCVTPERKSAKHECKGSVEKGSTKRRA
eukprot:s5190_g3.t1